MGIELEITPVVKDAIIDIDSSAFVNAMDDAMSQVENHMKSFVSTLQANMESIGPTQFSSLTERVDSITKRFSSMTQEWSQLFSMPMEELLQSRDSIDAYLTKLENIGQNSSQSYRDAEEGWRRVNDVISILNGSLDVTPDKLKEIVLTPIVKDVEDLRKEVEKSISVVNTASDRKPDSKGTASDTKKSMEDAPVKMAKEYAQLDKQLSSLQRKMESLVEKSLKFKEFGASTDQWSKLAWEVTRVRDKFEEVAQAMNAMRWDNKAFQTEASPAQLHEEYDRLAKKVKEFSNTARQVEIETPGRLQKVVSVLQRVSSVCNSVLSTVKKLISRFSVLGKTGSKSSTSLSKSLNKVWRNFMMFVLGFRSMYYLIKKLRTTFINELKLMATQIPEVNIQVSNMMKAMNQLKGSIATAFEPILQVVVPALTQLIAKLVEAANAVGTFFATITGRGYIYKFTADQQDYAASVAGTGKAAKEAKKDLMGFDEINRLSKDTDSGGSGAGSGAGGTWSKSDIENGTSKLAELMKEGWKKADFTEVGKYIASYLTNALDVATEKLNGPLKKKAEKIAKVFGTFLNGAFGDKGFAVSIGNFIASGINTAFATVNKFLSVTNFMNIGKFIQTAITQAIKKIDFKNIGDTLGKGLLSVADFAFGLLVNFDYASVGKKLGEGINQIFTVMNAKDENGSGWEKLGKSLSAGIDGLLTAILNALRTVDWTQVGVAIGEFIGSIDWGTIFSDMVAIVGAIISGICSTISGWADTDFLSLAFAGLLVTAFAGATVLTTITGALTKLLGSGLLQAFSGLGAEGTISSTVGKFFSTMFAGVKPSTVEAAADIATVTDAAEGLGAAAETTSGFALPGIITAIAGVATAVTSFLDMWNNGFSWVKETLMVVGLAIAAVGAIILGAPAVVAAVVAAVIALLATGVIWAKKHWTEIKEFFKFMVEDIKTRWKNMVANIKEFAGNLRDGVVEKITTIKTAFSNIFNGIKDIAKGAINFVIGGINAMIRGVVAGVNKIIGIANSLSFNIPDWVPEVGGKKFGLNLRTVSAPQIPLLAKGAVIPPNKEFLAMLGDQKSGTNIEAPLSTIQDAVALVMEDNIDAITAIGEAIVAAINNKDTSVIIGDREIGQAAARYNRRQNVIRGV